MPTKTTKTAPSAIDSRPTPDPRPVRLFYVTGTYHGSHVYSKSEGDARRTFHAHYNGESIVHVSSPKWPDPIPYHDPTDVETY